MVCPQTGKTHTVKIGKLSREDGDPLTDNDLFKGSLLILDYKGKSYPVEFKEFVGKTKSPILIKTLLMTSRPLNIATHHRQHVSMFATMHSL